MSYLGDMKDWQEGAQRALAGQAAESRPDDLDRFEDATLAALVELIEPLEDFPQSDRLLRTIGYARQRKAARAVDAARQGSPDTEEER
jgi:hypothetical protein